MTVGVYIIHCIPTDTYYVGESIAKRCRIWTHFKDLRGGKHSNARLQHSWSKYGKDGFSSRWVWLCDPEVEAILTRPQLSALTKRMEADIGNAMIAEGFSLFNFTPLEKWSLGNPATNRRVSKAISDAAKKRWQNPEYREKATASLRAIAQDPDRNRRLSEINKAARGSPEYRALFSARAKAQWADPEKRARLEEALNKTRFKRPVMCVETGETFESASAASRSLGKRNSAVTTAICTGKRCGGFTWRYID